MLCPYDGVCRGYAVTYGVAVGYIRSLSVISHLDKMEALLMAIVTALVAGMHAHDAGSVCQPLLSGGAFAVSALGFRHAGCACACPCFALGLSCTIPSVNKV